MWVTDKDCELQKVDKHARVIPLWWRIISSIPLIHIYDLKSILSTPADIVSL